MRNSVAVKVSAVLLTGAMLFGGAAGMTRTYAAEKGAAALAIFCVETGIFKAAASAGGGKFSLLRGLTMKDVEMSTPDESVVYANHDGQDLTISIYKPKEQSENLQPVYVYMHGGGWSSNNSETNSNIHRQMADAGFIGFSINYRLCTSGSTDNPTWDKAIYDCAEAMNWIKEHAAEYGGDASRIFLAGCTRSQCRTGYVSGR